jgi:transcriptional regulator with XRE-family HTH domain
MTIQDLGATIRRHRKAQGFTQVQLGILANVTPATIGRVEHGGDAKICTVWRLLDVLGLRLVCDAKKDSE